MAHPNVHRHEIRRFRWKQRSACELTSYEVTISIGQPGSRTAQDYTVQVTAVTDLLPSTQGLISDHAHIIVTHLDWSHIRSYLVQLARNCPQVSEREARDIFLRYFNESPVAHNLPPGRGRLSITGFDPPWHQQDGSITLTFGVNDKRSGPDAELRVEATTPAALTVRAAGGSLVLCHRATILVERMDLETIKTHIRQRVSSCSNADLASALPQLQKYFRADWEHSLSRNITY